MRVFKKQRRFIPEGIRKRGHLPLWIVIAATAIVAGIAPALACAPVISGGGSDKSGGTKPVSVTKTATCPSGNAMITHYSFVVNGTTQVAQLENNVHQGDKVKVNFTIAAGCSNEQISFVAYNAAGASFDVNTAPQQTVSSKDSGSFGAGDHSLSVTIPSCFYQVDFVRGPVIEHLGAGHLYSTTGSLIDAENGGSGVCGSSTPPPVVTPPPPPVKDCDNDTDNSKTTDSDCQAVTPPPTVTPTGSPSPTGGTDGNGGTSTGGTTTGGTNGSGSNSGGSTVAAASTSQVKAPANVGQVKAASISAPNTGHGNVIPAVLIAIAMVVVGFALVATTTFRKKAQQTS